MATNEPPGDNSNGTEKNPQETPVVTFIEEEVLSENPDLQTLLAVESENISGSSAAYLQYCSPRLHDEVDRVVQEVVDDLIAEQLLGEPPAKRSRYDDPGETVISDDYKETTSNVTTSTSRLSNTQVADSEPGSSIEDENCLGTKTIVDPSADSNLVIALKDHSYIKVESCNLLEATSNERSTLKNDDSIQVAANNDENRPVLETTIDSGDQLKKIIVVKDQSEPIEPTSDGSKFTTPKNNSKSVLAANDEKCPLPDTNVGPDSDSNHEIAMQDDAEPKKENSNLLEATAEKSINASRSTGLKLISETNGKHFLMKGTIVGPSDNTNLVIIINEDPEPDVEYSNLVEVTSEKNRSTALKTDSQSVAATNDENCLVPDTIVGPIAESILVIDINADSEPKVDGGIINEETSIKSTTQKIITPTNDEYGLVSDTTVDQCLKPNLPIDSKSLPRANADSCSSHTNLTAETIDLKSPVIKTKVYSSTQDEQSDTELGKTIENQRIFETAGTSGERRPSLAVRIEVSIQTNTSQMQVLQEPKENADNSTLPKCSDPGDEECGSWITCRLSSTSSETDSNTSDGSQITNKRKIQMLEVAEKYQDNICKKSKILGREEKVPLSETESSSRSGKSCSDVSTSNEDPDQENKKGDGSGEVAPVPDDGDEGLGAEPDGSSGESDEGVEFAVRRRPPTPPPRARGARRSCFPKYSDWFNYHRQDQF